MLAWHLCSVTLLNFVSINESDANVTETELDRRALCGLNSGRSDKVDYLEKGEF